MTIDINLIAARRAQRQRALAFMRLSFYGLFGLAILVVLLYAWLTVQIRIVSADIVQTEAVLSAPDMQQSLRRVTFLKGQIRELTPKVQVLKKVHDSESRWLEVLHTVGEQVPASVWVTGVASKEGDRKQQVINLSGSADSQRLVGAYMLALQQAQWCGPLQLLQSDSGNGGRDNNIVDFEIAIPLKESIGVNLLGKEAVPVPQKSGGSDDKIN